MPQCCGDCQVNNWPQHKVEWYCNSESPGWVCLGGLLDHLRQQPKLPAPGGRCQAVQQGAELLVCRWLPGTRGLVTLAWGLALLAASWKTLLRPKASFVISDVWSGFEVQDFVPFCCWQNGRECPQSSSAVWIRGGGMNRESSKSW